MKRYLESSVECLGVAGGSVDAVMICAPPVVPYISAIQPPPGECCAACALCAMCRTERRWVFCFFFRMGVIGFGGSGEWLLEMGRGGVVMYGVPPYPSVCVA